MRHSPRRLPSLGGWLSIFNCVAIILVMFVFDTRSWGSQWGQFGETLVACCILSLTVPTLWSFWIFRLNQHGIVFAIIFPVTIGLNAFAWGYGIEFVYRLTVPKGVLHNPNANNSDTPC
jgi:hypothetical protein